MRNLANLQAAVPPEDLPLQRAYHWERERAERIFLTQPMGGGLVTHITWARAMTEVRHMAAYLLAQEWPAGSSIAVFGKNSAHWIMADMAIWMAGHVSVPIYPTSSSDSLRYVLQHSEAQACFVGKLDDAGRLLTGIPGYVPLIPLPLSPTLAGEITSDFSLTLPSNPNTLLESNSWDAIVASTAALATSPLRDGDDLATLIYTSGTTGKPKGVMHSFNTMAWGLTSATRRVPMNSRDRYLSYLPLAHVAERMLVEQGALRHGSHIYFAEAVDTFGQDLQRARPTVFFSVPRLWVRFQQGVHAKMPPAKLQRLLKLPLIGGLVRRKVRQGLGLDQCRLAAGGAAPMPADTLGWFRNLGLDLIEVYGMTENCGVSHATLPGSCHPGTVGLPYDGVEQRIDAATGEIQMRSPALMLGYHKEPAMTAAAMTADGWLRTGDKGEIGADGLLRITGRLKDIFKTSKGKYIAPAPLEDLLVTHPDIEACAVTGANLDQPLAIVMLSADAIARAATPDGRRAMTASLAAHLVALNAQLESHEKLACLAVTTRPWTPENGFVTPTLKVKRDRVDQTYAASFAKWLALNQPVLWLDAIPQT